jgi:hypothetical protein
MKPLLLASLLVLSGCAATLPASPGMLQPQDPDKPAAPAAPARAARTPRPDGALAAPYTPPPRVKVDAAMKEDAIKKGIPILLKLQQGKDKAEWPYEGVYRVDGQIPWGYRLGGTAIVVSALTEAPGYSDDKDRQAAVARALKFMCECKDQPLLGLGELNEGYDVRSWGHIQAVYTLCRMKQMKLIPDDQAKAVEEAVTFYLDAIHKLEEPKTGGWNYSRPQGGPPSTFMTSSALHALFEAAKAGYKVDPDVVKRGLEFLDKARAASGAVMYAGNAHAGEERMSDAVPGAVGRMNSAESTLFLGGRGSAANVRAAVDAFIVNWEWLDRRRVQTGTHIPPYMVAPYYFMYAHYFAAEAVELLPKAEREEYRRHINELLFSVRSEDGSWNDRVFERSSAYGTAMAMLAIMAPDRQPPAKWEPPKEEAAKQGT